MSVSIAREQGAFVRWPSATPQEASATAPALTTVRGTPSLSAPAAAPSRGAAELSQALAAFLSQYNDNSSNGATASARHVTEAYGAASETFEASSTAAPSSVSPSAIDSALDTLQADFDSLIYNLRSVNAQQADPSRPMASSYTMPGTKSTDTVTQMKSDVADFVGGLMKVTLAIGQSDPAREAAAPALQPSVSPVATPSAPASAQPVVESDKAPQATVLYRPESAAPAAAPKVFTGYNPSDQRSSLFGRMQRHFSEL